MVASTIGYKTKNIRSGAHEETMSDLHDTAFWLGLRVLSVDDPDARFAYEVWFDDFCSYTGVVESGNCSFLPMLIPAAVSNASNMAMKITPLNSYNGPYQLRLLFDEAVVEE